MGSYDQTLTAFGIIFLIIGLIVWGIRIVAVLAVIYLVAYLVISTIKRRRRNSRKDIGNKSNDSSYYSGFDG